MTKRSCLRWLPAVVMMVVIFAASNTPAKLIPSFGPLDVIIRKAGHMTGYGLLAAAYWYGMHLNKNLGWLAFLLAILYAMTDEFHQIFCFRQTPKLGGRAGFRRRRCEYWAISLRVAAGK